MCVCVCVCVCVRARACVCLIPCKFRKPRGLRRGCEAARFLRSWVRIPPGAWMFVCCECCVLSGRGLCDELITRPEESYRLWCVVVWSRNLKNEEIMARVGPQRHRRNGIFIYSSLPFEALIVLMKADLWQVRSQFQGNFISNIPRFP